MQDEVKSRLTVRYDFGLARDWSIYQLGKKKKGQLELDKNSPILAEGILACENDSVIKCRIIYIMCIYDMVLFM